MKLDTCAGRHIAIMHLISLFSFKVVGNLTTTNNYVDNWCPAAFKGTYVLPNYTCLL